ncbi:hypothetical protein [Streptomyces syringium]|uniref:hypothetical protein n=1 Tax=Streptomyces syringium TaxID=76729 RepID=UPI0037D440EA
MDPAAAGPACDTDALGRSGAGTTSTMAAVNTAAAYRATGAALGAAPAAATPAGGDHGVPLLDLAPAPTATTTSEPGLAVFSILASV